MTGRRVIGFLFCLLMPVLVHGELPDRLTVSFVPDLKPNSYFDEEGERTGLFIDLLKEFGNRYDIEIVYVDGTFAENYERAVTGEIDLLTSVAYTEERRAALDYVEEPVFASWTQVITHKDSPIDGALDLDGATLSVMQKDQNADAFREFARRLDIEVEYSFHDSYASALSHTNMGETEGAVIYNALDISPYPNLSRSDVILNSVAGSYATRKGHIPGVIALLETQLSTWKADPYSFFYETLQKHYGFRPEPTTARVPRWLILSLVVLSGTAVISFVAIRSLTARLRGANLKLQHLNAGLEQEVKSRTAELEASQARLMSAEKHASLSRMLSGMAHELNTPLGVARTAASYLSSELQRVTSESVHGSSEYDAYNTLVDSSEIVEQNVDRAVRLVRSVRDVLSEQLVTSESQVNLREYINLVWASHGPRLEAAGHRHELNVPSVIVSMNPHIMDEILAILVNNTLAHAFPDGNHGSIRLLVSVTSADGVVLDYQDNGAGIPESAHTLVFEPFYSTGREYGHAGIGLYVLQVLIDRMGGAIQLTTPKSSGTRFVISLPVAVDGNGVKPGDADQGSRSTPL